MEEELNMTEVEQLEQCLKLLDINTNIKSLTKIIAVYEEVKKRGDELTVREVIQIGLTADKQK